MSSVDSFLQLTNHHKNLAIHWADVHYASVRYYRSIEWLLGIASIILATLLLGSAGYTVERDDAPLWLQYGLLGLAIAQAAIAAVQSYMRPAALAERYRGSAANYGSLVRKWVLFEMRVSLGEFPSVKQVEEMMVAVDQVAREAPEVPWLVIMCYGKPNSRNEAAVNAAAEPHRGG